ncbi:MAG: alanine racemase [bacterium]
MNQRPTFAEIDLRAIAYNIKEIQKKVAPAQVMAVVKADAYGHGLNAVAEAAIANEVKYLGVALLEEGIKLRKYKFNIPILVFGGFFENQIDDFLHYDLELTLFDLSRARVLAKNAQAFGKSAKVHVKVDTGMGRIGVHWQNAVEFVQQVAEFTYIEIEGIYTHFASSDEKDKTYAKTQLRRFQEVFAQLEQRKINIPIKHAANSAAVLDLPESYLSMVRIGVSMYGYYPSLETTESVSLKPAMSIKSRVIAVKEVEAGTYISYNRTYQTKNKTTMATVPIGYGDGYNRLLSNQGEVLIRGQRFPVVGRVCMDQTMVDVGLESQVEVGDEVVLLGCQGKEEITIYEICEKLNTIPYEVTCWVSGRMPRHYKNH